MITRLSNDSEFEDRDRLISIFVEEEFLGQMNCSNNNNKNQSDCKYYALKKLHQIFLKEEHEKDNNEGHLNLDPFRIIEKAVNFLRRRFDRFKFNRDFDELSKISEMLKVDKTDYGFENLIDRYVIWKKERNKEWTKMAEYYFKNKIIKTKLKVKWKKRRRKIYLIISLMKKFIENWGWRAKPGNLWNVINQNTLKEFYLWNLSCRNNLAVKKREFLKGRKFKCDQNASSIHDVENVISCNFRCNLRCEKEDKFIFRFKRKRRKCNQLDAFKEFFMLSKKTIVRWKNLEKFMLEKTMKNICTKSVVKFTVNNTQFKENEKGKEFQDKMSDLCRVKLL
jgi:hypothetical protein